MTNRNEHQRLFNRYRQIAQTLSDEEKITRPAETVNIGDELARREKIRNQALQQDISSKKLTLILLFLFLGIETAAVFWLTYLQAIETNDFRMEEWTFRLLLAATIIQITYLLRMAVKHLFPEQNAVSGS